MTATVTDITLQARLRYWAVNQDDEGVPCSMLREAADRIDELEAQLGRWVELAMYQKGELQKAKQLIGGGE